jgi:hypothetical protein
LAAFLPITNPAKPAMHNPRRKQTMTMNRSARCCLEIPLPRPREPRDLAGVRFFSRLDDPLPERLRRLHWEEDSFSGVVGPSSVGFCEVPESIG